MNTTFSAKNRANALEHMSSEVLDVLVIGGGITGSGIALDAVTRGMTTGLVEMQDYAAGTSSRSTKLVHGGLRYLKQFEVKMVAEVGKERAVVYENGPHVTTPEWMLLPFHKGGTFGSFSTSIGLRVYDYLAGVKRNERRKMLSVKETMGKEPLIKKDGLQGGGYYVEYRTDDARLTIEVIKEAVKRGAYAANYTKASEFIYENGKLKGVKVTDTISGQEYSIFARKVINAAGPWVDTLRQLDKSKKGKVLQMTKGIHLVIDHERFPLEQAVYFDTPDGRMVFAIPRDGKTYVGTTDTVYKADPIHPQMTLEDRDYVLKAINYMFPTVKVTAADVESSWAGVRPLIYEEGKDPSEISRKDEVWQSASGLITIAGGKLTGYRKMAEMVIDLAAELIGKEQGKKFKACQTKHMAMSGGDVGGSANLPAFILQQGDKGRQAGLTHEQAEYLAGFYGSNVSKLFDLVRQADPIADELGLPADIRARIAYAIQEEMTVKPVDFFIRRTGALFFNINWVHEWKQPVIEYMSRRFNWTADQKRRYTDELEGHLHDAVVPSDAPTKSEFAV